MSKRKPIEEYDSNGNLIHIKYPNGKEWWYEYYPNGIEIHYKSSYGYEWWKEYDSHGKLIRIKYSNGHEYWYDEKGNRTEDPVKILLLSQKLYSELSK